MKTTKVVFLTLAAVAVAGAGVRLAMFWKDGPTPQGQCTPRPEAEGWIDLLDAANTPQWKNITDSLDIFEIKDGILHIFGHTPPPLRYAGYTGERFGNFALHLEFKVSWRANSGVFLRAQPEDPVYRGFEIQVLDDHGQRPNKNGCGSVYDVVTPMFNMSLPRGEWNSYDIVAQDEKITVHMNGWKIIDADFAQMTEPLGKFSVPFCSLPLDGILALQDHGGEVWYRNILVKKL